MSVMRINKNKNYTVMSNYHLQDKNLSLKAKGLLSIMLSLPEGWDYSVKGLVAICKEGETAVESALDELKKYGYLVVTKIFPNKENGGKYEYIYDIFEVPNENQGVENQGVGFLGVENMGLNKDIDNNISKDNEITKKENTKEENIPPLSPRGEKTWQEEMIADKCINGKLKDTIMEFLEYKKERKNNYKPKGFSALLSEINNNVAKYGEDPVIECIKYAILSNYQGIPFGRLAYGKKQKNNDTVRRFLEND